MSIAIVSFANENGNYRKAMTRMFGSFRAVGLDFTAYAFQDEKKIHPDCPLHSEVPYAFKPWAMRKAMEDGHDLIIWADSPIYATKDVSPFISHIKDNGYIFFDNIGYSVGDYTSDNCLNLYGVDRNESFQMRMIMACLMGLNMNNPEAWLFFNRYFDGAKNGAYKGAWNNHENCVSQDLRVMGHRHDQSVASIVINQLNLNITTGQDTYFAYASHKGNLRLADSICIWSQGL